MSVADGWNFILSQLRFRFIRLSSRVVFISLVWGFRCRCFFIQFALMFFLAYVFLPLFSSSEISPLDFIYARIISLLNSAFVWNFYVVLSPLVPTLGSSELNLFLCPVMFRDKLDLAEIGVCGF